MALNQAGRNFPQGPDCAPANICTDQDDYSKVTEYEMLISSLPLSTSTPATGRTSPQSFSSFVSFLKLDDSGFGETLHSTPSVTASISSHSFQEENGKAGFFSTPISHISQVEAHRRQFSKPLSRLDSLTESPYFLPAGPGVTTLRDDCHQSFYLSDQERFPKSQNKFYKICSEWQQEDVDLLDDEAYYSRLGCSSASENSVQSHNSDLVESFNRALKGFSPPVPSKLIGRKIGVETIDIVTELRASGLDVISLLLPYLRPQDILSMSLVCTLWRQLCLENSRARHKRQEAMTLPLQMNKGKENAIGKESRHLDIRRTMTASKGHLAEIQPLQKSPDATSPVHMINSSPFLYEQARKSLRWGENFRHCPKCNSAAKIVAGQDRGKCVNPHCWSDFCTRCLAPYHFTKPCTLGSMRTLKTELIGSKKSRKNLRRL